MSEINRTEHAERIRRAVQAVLRQNHLEHSCFLLTRVAQINQISSWEIVVMTSRGKITLSLETGADESDDDLCTTTAAAIAHALPSLACPTCNGSGFISHR